MRDRLIPSEGQMLAALIGFAPVVVLALTWDPDGATSQFARAIREYALPILAVEGMVIGVAILSGLTGWVRLAPRPVLAALACWLLVAAATALLVAVRQDLSIFRTCVWIVHGLFAAAVAFLVKTGRITPDDLAKALLAGFVVYGAAISLFALQVDNEIRWVIDIPGLGNLRRIGAYATIITAVGLGFAGGRYKAVAIAAVVAALFVAFWTGTRATIPAVAAGLLVGSLFWSRARNWKTWFLFLLAALVALLLASIFPVEMEQGTTRFRAVTEVGDNGRLRLWTLALQAIGNSPWFGYGEAQTALILPRNPALAADFQAHPHNLILQILMAWGIIGLAALAIIAGWLVSRLWQTRNSGMSEPFGMGLAALLAHSMIDGALYDVAPVFLFAACLGAVVVSRDDPPPAQQTMADPASP